LRAIGATAPIGAATGGRHIGVIDREIWPKPGRRIP
jgi:hypothetical protein